MRIYRFEDTVSAILDKNVLTFYKTKNEEEVVVTFSKEGLIISEEVDEMPFGLVGISPEIDGKVFTAAIGKQIYCRLSELPEEFKESGFIEINDFGVAQVYFGDYLVEYRQNDNNYTMTIHVLSTLESMTESGEFE